MLLPAMVSAATSDCTGCADCSEKIQNATYGDTVQLTADIINHDGTCIEFNGKDGITFDGGNHTINGSSTDYGIHLSAYSNTNTIKNCEISDFRYGIYLYTSSYNTLQNINAYSSSGGVTILYGTDNRLIDSILEENSYYDFHFVPNLRIDCDTTLINVTGSGDRPIAFYNQTVNIENQEFSALYLCTSDSSTLNNITVAGSDTLKNNGIRIYHTYEATLTNIVSSDNFNGIQLDDSNAVTIQNITCNNSHHYNIDVRYGSYNTLENIVTSSSSQAGIYLYHAPDNIITNATVSSNPIGIRLDTSPSTTINNSHMTDNFIVGLNVGNSDMNLIYNNYFNNTNNINIGTIYVNDWNTTKTSGTNIIGGPNTGGNYWATPSGTGYSEICMDNNNDGFCDTSYNLATDNIDYLPLTEIILPRTIYVNETGWWIEPDQFNASATPIQSAINNANSGDLVYVYGGNYNENVDIGKHITLQGEGADVVTVTAASPSDHVFDITVDKVNISGFTVTGVTGYIAGIYMDNVSDCLISDNNVLSKHHGIYLYLSSNNTLSGNTVDSSVEYGIYLHSSDYNNVVGNTVNFSGSHNIYLRSSTHNNVTGNTADSSERNGIYMSSLSNYNTLTGNNVSNNERGFYMHYSINNTLSDNIIAGNIYNFGLYGSELSHYTHNISSDNTVDGKPVYYLVNRQDQQIPTGAGLVGLVNCTNITVKDQILTGNSYGVLLSYSNSSVIENVTASGNADYGIYMHYSNNNTLSGNIASSTNEGIYLYYSGSNTLKNNTADSTVYSGIYLHYSDNNTLTNNTANSNSLYGINIVSSGSNTIKDNTADNNSDYGIYLYSADNNSIYNNHFNNTYNVRFEGTFYTNDWNTTKTSGTNIIGGPYLGGNYWAHPNGTGYSQICTDTDKDGFCDSPYAIATNNTDYLPLTDKYTQAYSITISLYKQLNNTGLNLITLPLEHSFTTAEDLCQNITYSDTITRWDPLTQQYIGHPCTTPFNNFILNNGEGYFVSVTQNTIWTLKGAKLTLPPIDLKKVQNNTGLNLIGLPYNSTITPFTAEGLCQNITYSDTITQWNPITQQYIGHPCTTPFNNFILNNGEGYFASVTQNTTWMPQ